MRLAAPNPLKSYALLAFWVVNLVFLGGACAQATKSTTPQLVTEDYLIPARDPGIQLYVRNKRPGGMTAFTHEKTLLFAHGANDPAESVIDLTLSSISWMDYIAQHGWDVWLVDIRGYGRSTRPPEMDRPATGSPILTTNAALQDLSAAVDHILKRREISKITLMGWSRGCTLMATYTADNTEKVKRLVLYAPPWVSKTAPPSGSRTPLPAYKSFTLEAARERWLKPVPERKRGELIPIGWFETWWAANLVSDPAGAKQSPPVFRSPNGWFQNPNEYLSAGKSFYYDPSKITVPSLIVHAEWDDITPSYMAQEIFSGLTNVPYKRFVEIGEGTHFVHREKNRTQLFREVQLFLDEPHPVK